MRFEAMVISLCPMWLKRDEGIRMMRRRTSNYY